MNLSALAGIVGGIAVSGAVMIYSAVIGGGFWSLPNSIGDIVMGVKAGNTRSFGIVTLLGFYFHIVLSAINGIATVYLAHQLNIGFGVVTFSENDCDDPSGAQLTRVSDPELPIRRWPCGGEYGWREQSVLSGAGRTDCTEPRTSK